MSRSPARTGPGLGPWVLGAAVILSAGGAGGALAPAPAAGKPGETAKDAHPTPVEVTRSGAIETTVAHLPGMLLDAAVARDAAGRRGLVLLVATGAGRPSAPREEAAGPDGDAEVSGVADDPAPGRPREAFFLVPGGGALEPLAGGLPPRASAIAALTLAGDGEERADALIAGEASALYALDPPWGSAPAGRWRRVLAGQGLDLRSVRGSDGREGGRPRARLPRLPVAHAGGFELLAAGAADRGPIELHPAASFPLPLAAARTPWGLELGGHPVQLLPGPWPSLALDRPGADGGPAVPSGAAARFAVGPEAQGRQRLRTLLLPAAAGEAPVEAWSLRPAPGQVDESRYDLWEGRPVLVLSSVPKLGIFVKREVQIFLLSPDRSRGGSPPVLSAVTGCHMWQRLTTHFVALDGGGRQDFVLIHPDGLRGRKLHFEVWSGLGGNRLDPRSTASTVDVEPEEWYYGADFSGDRTPGLMVRSGGRLLLYPGVAGKRRLAERPAWSFQLPEPPPRSTKPREKDGDGGGGPEANAPGSATPPEGRLGALVDLRGDGQGNGHSALVLTVADAEGRTQVVTVRRVQ